MEIAVEEFAVICFFLIGVSHIVQSRAWAEFFIRLREKGTTGSFINAWIDFPLGGTHCRLSQCVARHSRDSNGAGVCVGVKRSYVFRFSAIRVEGDGASAARPCLGVCGCRYRDRRAGRFIVVFVDKQRRTALKATAFGDDGRSTYVTRLGTRIDLSRFGDPPDFNAAITQQNWHEARSQYTGNNLA